MGEILIVEINYNLNEFITNDGNTYPILFDIDENTSISDLRASFTGRIYSKRVKENRKKRLNVN